MGGRTQVGKQNSSARRDPRLATGAVNVKVSSALQPHYAPCLPGRWQPKERAKGVCGVKASVLLWLLTLYLLLCWRPFAD